MTTQTEPRVVSLSTELAQPDDERRQSAQRWHAALHRLCMLRATANETSYEAEWLRIFEDQTLTHDMQHRSKLLAVAAIDVLGVQHEHSMLVFDAEDVPYDTGVAEQIRELLDAMRIKIEQDLP